MLPLLYKAPPTPPQRKTPLYKGNVIQFVSFRLTEGSGEIRNACFEKTDLAMRFA